MAKIFERLILLRLTEIELEEGIDLTGEGQHGFKKGCSTNTAMLQIQAQITEILEKGQLAGIISLDLTAAFDVIDHEELLIRMTKVGIPNDVTSLVKSWLEDRSAFVEVGTHTSEFYDVPIGTVQGSVLGPILFAIFVKGIQLIEPITIFADDNYLVCGHENVEELKNQLTQKTTRIYNWLTKSGLQVNMDKTELLIISPRTTNLSITVDNKKVTSKSEMKILGVTFDSKLTWSQHISNVTTKINKLCFGLRKIKRNFTTEEMLRLVTTLGHSKLYYGAPVWLSRHLHKINQRKLLRASSNLIKSCISNQDWTLISYNNLHELAGKPTPMQMSDYIQATTLWSIIQTGKPEMVWLKLQINCRENRRTGSMTFGNGQMSPYGKHNFGNRMMHVSQKLPGQWDQMTKYSFKRMCKTIFFT